MWSPICNRIFCLYDFDLQAYHAYGIPGREVVKVANIVAGKRLIGVFKCDVGTVYAAPSRSSICCSQIQMT